MRKLLSRFAPIAAIALAVGMVAPQSAYAANATAGVVAGSGTISPGLTTTPTAQTAVTFSGTLAGLGLVAYGGPSPVDFAFSGETCTFNGSSTGTETTATGQGTVTGACSGPAIVVSVSGGVENGTATLNCTVTYRRVGTVVVILVTCTGTLVAVSGTTSGTTAVGAGAFLFEPTSTSPTTSYVLQGAATGAG